MSHASPRRRSTTPALRATVAACTIALFLPCGALAQSGGAPAPSLSGTVTSADGTPIANATVLLYGPGGDTSVRTDAAGHFAASGLRAGVYAVRIDAPGFDALSGRTVGVASGAAASASFALMRTAAALLTIGRTETTLPGTSLSTSSAPSSQLNPQTYASRGTTYLTDVLQNDISTTLVHPLGGGFSVLPTSVALRGPDPTETLVDIDGHRVNNGNTGDFDVSLLDPAQFSDIELVKGISPSSLVGPNTIDGAINLQTLEPTDKPHELARFNYGSFNAFGETLQTTGTANRLGYAFSLHRATTSGQIDQSILDQTSGASEATIGSTSLSSTAIAKLRYAFGRTRDGYAELSFRDQAQNRDLSAALTTQLGTSAPVSDAATLRRSQDDPLLVGFEGTTLRAHTAGYGLDVRTPIGAPDGSGVSPASLLFRAFRSNLSQSTAGPGAETSPYLFNTGDRIDDESLEFDRQFRNASVTVQYDVRSESLRTDFITGIVNDQAVLRRAASTRSSQPLAIAGSAALATVDLGQTQRSLALRYTYDPVAKVHLTAAGYYSRFSIFGSSLDPRFGAVYTPDALTAIRASAGTTFQTPQLPELYTPSVLPNAIGQAVTVGNPNLQPDRATEYGLGVERVLETGSHRSTISLDLYRVNLRNAATALVPSVDPTCGDVARGGDGTPCPFTYTVNAGNAVYQGFELQAERRIMPFTDLRAGFAVRSAFLRSVDPSVQNGTLVAGEQSLGLPLQKGTLSLEHAPPLGVNAFGALVYEGEYNELHRSPYATLAAGVGYRLKAFEIAISGTNLTDAYDNKFTSPTGGVPYAIQGGTATTAAYSLAAPTVTLSLTRRL